MEAILALIAGVLGALATWLYQRGKASERSKQVAHLERSKQTFRQVRLQHDVERAEDRKAYAEKVRELEETIHAEPMSEAEVVELRDRARREWSEPD